MQGLGLLRQLTSEQYQFFGRALEHNMSRAKPGESDVFAQRLFVLRHLTHPSGGHAPTQEHTHTDSSQEGFQGHEMMHANVYAPPVRRSVCANASLQRSVSVILQALQMPPVLSAVS